MLILFGYANLEAFFTEKTMFKRDIVFPLPSHTMSILTFSFLKKFKLDYVMNNFYL